MKKIILLALMFCAFIHQFQAQKTTYYLIRHAEKDRRNPENQDPNLNEIGILRSEKWATYFKEIPLDAIYSTNYKRTLQTAKPTATDKKLEILFYNPKELYTSDFQLKTQGKTVLIVGHSNTTPAFVNKILNENKVAEMDDHDNSSLFVITIQNKDKDFKILKVEN